MEGNIMKPKEKCVIFNITDFYQNILLFWLELLYSLKKQSVCVAYISYRRSYHWSMEGNIMKPKDFYLNQLFMKIL
jgi:hypothetical protein